MGIAMPISNMHGPRPKGRGFNISMKKRLTQKEIREIMLKNAQVLMSEKYRTKQQEISGEKRIKS